MQYVEVHSGLGRSVCPHNASLIIFFPTADIFSLTVKVDFRSTFKRHTTYFDMKKAFIRIKMLVFKTNILNTCHLDFFFFILQFKKKNLNTIPEGNNVTGL